MWVVESIHHKALSQWHWQFLPNSSKICIINHPSPLTTIDYDLLSQIESDTHILSSSECTRWHLTVFEMPHSKENSSASSPPEGFRSHVSCRGQLSLSWLDATRIFNTRTVMSMTWKGSTGLILRLAVFYWTQALPWFLCQNLTHTWGEQGNYKYTHQGSLK